MNPEAVLLWELKFVNHSDHTVTKTIEKKP